MQNKRMELEERLSQARVDFAEIETALAAHADLKAAAAIDAGEYVKWRARNEQLASEHDRLPLVIVALEGEIEANSAAALDAHKRERHAARQTANAKLAARTRTELTEIVASTFALIRDHACAVIETQDINQHLPEGLAPLVTPDRLARDGEALLRKALTTERVWLWVNSETSELIGNQDVVEQQPDGRGIIPLKGRKPVRCEGRPFDRITFNPPQPAERFVPIWQMSVVDPSGPRRMFDGADLIQPRDVLKALEFAENQGPRERTVEVELVPVLIDTN